LKDDEGATQRYDAIVQWERVPFLSQLARSLDPFVWLVGCNLLLPVSGPSTKFNVVDHIPYTNFYWHWRAAGLDLLTFIGFVLGVRLIIRTVPWSQGEYLLAHACTAELAFTFVLVFVVLSVATVKHLYRNSLVLLLVCASPLETLFLELFRAHRSTPRFSSNSRQTCSHHGHLPRWPHRRDHQGSMRLPPHAEHCGHHGRWHCGSQTLLLELFLVHRPNQRCPSRSLQPRSHQNHLQRCPHRLDYQGSKCLHIHADYYGASTIRLPSYLVYSGEYLLARTCTAELAFTEVLAFVVLSMATVKYTPIGILWFCYWHVRHRWKYCSSCLERIAQSSALTSTPQSPEAVSSAGHTDLTIKEVSAYILMQFIAGITAAFSYGAIYGSLPLFSHLRCCLWLQ